MYNENKILEKKLDIIRRNVKNIRDFIEKLSQLRPEQYEVKNEEWLYKIDKINSILESNSYFLFIGKFSSGKSSFINALLGKNILPTASQPCTAVVTEVSFVDSEFNNARSGEIFYKSNPDDGIPKTREDLLEIIGGKTNIELGSIHHISIKFDFNEFGENSDMYKSLVDKVVIVDCPGFDSPYRFSEDILIDYIEKSSYTFYFLPANDFGGQSDVSRLHKIKKRTATLIPIISKSDLITSDEEKEDIETRFNNALGSAFTSQSPIFVSTFKYNELMEFVQNNMDKIVSNKLSQEETDKKNRLASECGIHNVYSQMISKSKDSSLNSKKLESVLVDFNNLVDELRKNYTKEESYWKKELSIQNFDINSNLYSDLENFEKEMRNYISQESEEASKVIKNRIISEIMKAQIQNGKGNTDLESKIKEAVDEEFNRYKPKWEAKIKGSFDVIGKNIKNLNVDAEKIKALHINKDLPLSYIPMGLVKAFSKYGAGSPGSVVAGISGATLIGLESNIAAFSLPLIGAIGTTLAPIAVMGGAALLGFTAIKNISPLKEGIEDEKRRREDEMRLQISNLLADAHGFDLTNEIREVLSSYKDSIISAVSNERKSKKDKSLDNYYKCIDNRYNLEKIQNNMDQQLN